MRPSELDAIPTEMLLGAVGRRLEVVDMLEAKKEPPVPALEIYGRLQALVEVARSAVALLQDALRDLDGAAVAELGRQHEIVARRHSELQRLYQVRLEVTRAALDRAQTSASASQAAASGRSASNGGKNQAPV